jgi:hypothetical protein
MYFLTVNFNSILSEPNLNQNWPKRDCYAFRQRCLTVLTSVRVDGAVVRGMAGIKKSIF